MKDVHLDTVLPSGSFTAERADLSVAGSSRVSSHGGHAVGDVLAGKYRIVSFLGEGGMGTVWRAHNLQLDVGVAIKVLRGEHAGDDASARFVREAQATASLRHSAIVRVFDFNETDTGESFLVMELLEGMSLADWIDRQGRMPAIEAVRTLLPIADALMAAHAHGVVHRDVKPTNIVLVPGEAGACLPKILDFGIAKLLTSGNGRVITQEGAVLGSLEYMSPEQAEGNGEVGEQTDVWALSVVLYELVTGRRPFIGSTLTQILWSLRRGQATPTTQLGAGDEDLWEIIARGLQRSRTERWPDMHAFGSALAAWAVRRGVTTDATGMSLPHHWLATPSQPPDERVSEPWISTGPPRSAAARLGTLHAPCAAGATPSLQWTRTILAAAAAVLVAAPLLLAAGLHAHHGQGSTSPGAFDPVAVAGANALVMAIEPSAAPPAGGAPEPAPAPSAAAADSASEPAPPAAPPPPRRVAPAARPKSVATGERLPAPPKPWWDRGPRAQRHP